MPFSLGSAVRLTGLKSKPELNDQRGRVIGWDAEKGRLNVAIHRGGKTIQVKPVNVVAFDPSKQRVEDMNSEDLVKLTLQSRRPLTSEHGRRIIELLKQMGMAPTDAIDAGNLLRCCCACEWLVSALHHPKTGENRVEPSPDMSEGKGLVLYTTTERCVQIAGAAPPPAKGLSRVALRVLGRDLFAQSSLAAFVSDGVKVIGLDEHPGDGGAPQPGSPLPVFALREEMFPALQHMSSALVLESALPDLCAALPKLRAPPADRSAVAEQLRAFAQHTFFCFNASSDPSSILPLTAMHEGSSYMLLYTCEIVLELARGVLDELGAFRAYGGHVASGPLPASYLVAALTSATAANAGVHINEFVPGIRDECKLAALPTADLSTLMEAAAV